MRIRAKFPNPHFAIGSEHELEAELNIPSTKTRRGPAELRTADVGTAPSVRAKVLKVHSVEEIEEFRAKLDARSLRSQEPGDFGFLGDVQIRIGITGSIEDIATQSTVLPDPWPGKVGSLEKACQKAGPVAVDTARLKTRARLNNRN